MEIGKILNPSNIRDFVQGNYMMLKDSLTNKGIQEHYKEQAIYRAMLCKPCLLNGSCTVCKCKTPNMFFSFHKVDAGGKWGAMMELPEWEAYKEENDIKDLPNSFELIKELNTELNDGHTG